jgi:hypothetical protein
MNILFPRTKSELWPNSSILLSLNQTILLNGSRKLTGIPATDSGGLGTFGSFGPATFTTDKLGKSNNGNNATFYYTTNREIGPGLFLTKDKTTALVPSGNGIIAGALNRPVNDPLGLGGCILAGSLSAQLAFNNPSGIENYSVLGARAGSIGQNTQILGYTANSGTFDPTIYARFNEYSNLSSTYIGAQAGLSIVPVQKALLLGRNYPVSRNIAIGYNSMGFPDKAPSKATYAASKAVAIGYNTCRGAKGSIYESGTSDLVYSETQFAIIGSDSYSNGNPGLISYYIEDLWGDVVCLGAKTLNKATAVTVYGRASDPRSDGTPLTTIIGSNILYNKATPLYAATVLNNSGSEFPTVNLVGVTNLGIPGSPVLLQVTGRLGNMGGPGLTYDPIGPLLRLQPVAFPDGVHFFCLGKSTSDYTYILTANLTTGSGTLLPNRRVVPGDYVGRGPIVSQGGADTWVCSNSVKEKGYGASGTFKDSSGKIYTVVNGLISSVA